MADKRIPSLDMFNPLQPHAHGVCADRADRGKLDGCRDRGRDGLPRDRDKAPAGEVGCGGLGQQKDLVDTQLLRQFQRGVDQPAAESLPAVWGRYRHRPDIRQENLSGAAALRHPVSSRIR